MAPLKEAIIKMIKKMPESASVSDIMAELYFRTKVDQGLEDLMTKRTFSHEKTKMNFRKWLKRK